MDAYFLDKDTLEPVYQCFVTEYEVEQNNEYKGKSEVILPEKPSIRAGDYMIGTEGGELVMQGVVGEIGSTDGAAHRPMILELPSVFDRDLIIANEPLLQTGIEDFIKQTIEEQFINIDDPQIAMPYFTVEALTHTPVFTGINETEAQVYNFMDFLVTALQVHSVFLDFEISTSGIAIKIVRRETVEQTLDGTATDIVGLTELYEMDAVTRADIVCAQKSNNVSTYSYGTYFLCDDGTITQDVAAENRMAGRANAKEVNSVKDTPVSSTMLQAAQDEFNRNKYEHRIEFGLLKQSRLYDWHTLIVGLPLLIKTASGGVRETQIRSRAHSNESAAVQIVCGNYSDSLTEKLLGGGWRV